MRTAAVRRSENGPIGTVGTVVAYGSTLAVPTEPADSGLTIVGDCEGFVCRITVPRRILLELRAGDPVDEVIATLLRCDRFGSDPFERVDRPRGERCNRDRSVRTVRLGRGGRVHQHTWSTSSDDAHPTVHDHPGAIHEPAPLPREESDALRDLLWSPHPAIQLAR